MIKNILKGIQAYTNSFSLISKLKLWKYFAIPILISVLVAIVIVIIAFTLSDNIGHYIASIWKWDWGKETFEVISTFLSGLIIVAIGLILYKHIVMALSAPFMSPVSEKIENHLRGKTHQHRNTSFSEQLIRGIRINIRNLFKELLFTILILLLSFIPVIGILSSVLLLLVQAYYAGFGNMDYTLERHYKYKESIEFVRKNRGLAIGNGIVFILMLLIPVIGVILVLPLSVTAASTQTIKEIQAKELSK
ncbi:EI24 domain-containing protein [Tenacibaculum sp. IB213877]|uniref:EI24 domain-containing protein n=1 Tax=Tenacibaculum sp. IB213877 TaxID=3097351 RepID=UPI002A59F6F3|nr:EI24 domain-containing protein [Tenacibaculum sp. IB213877]MDY0779788.1 EI24 domain-containing protein [Tenacibaculum sp. IB213877]